MPLRRLAASLALAALATVAGQTSASSAEDAEQAATLCEAAIVNGARRGGVPQEVLHAIALTETGRKSGGRIRPYPWAINREGKGHWFKTRAEAVAFAEQSLAAGRRSFDVGCVQINYRWHGHAFPSLDAMFDPEWTATYAAQFLRTLYEERGSWSEAAGAYHSLTPELARTYRGRFDRLLAGVSPDDLNRELAESGTVIIPGSNLSERAQLRQAHVDAIRLARQAPPPGSAMGAVGQGHMVTRTTVGLLSPGTSLLTPGRPIMAAPRGGLF